jgi:hypothetical protein
MVKTVTPVQYSHMTPIEYTELRCAFDPEKLEAYESFCKDYVKDKVVCDLGAGCGILSHIALHYGASKVICMDQNDKALEIAKRLLNTDKAEYITCDLTNVTFPEADIYIHEIFGTVLYEERITCIFSNLKRQGLENKCFPNKGEFFSFECDKLTEEDYEYNIEDFPEATKEYHALLNEEEIKLGSKVMSSRFYNYKEKKLLKSFDLSVDSGTRYIYNMLELVPRFGWRAYFPNGASFSNTPRIGNNWYVLDGSRNGRYVKRMQLTYKPETITNPYEVD